MYDYPDHEHSHGHGHEHGHTHGLVDESIVRSKEGVQAVSWSLGVLLATALLQLAIFYSTNSISLFADLIHNFGDALTALPLGVAFFLRNRIAETNAGYFVVATLALSGIVTAVEAIGRLIHPEAVTNIPVLILAGLVGFAGNEIAAIIRLRAGKHLHSPALIADGHHARADGFVSLAVVASAVLITLNIPIADTLIGLFITLVILRIAYQSFVSIRQS